MNPYSGKSTLAAVLRVSAFTFGAVYGSWKLSSYKKEAAMNRAKKAAAEAAHH